MAPDVGATFTYQGDRYHVDAWLRRAPAPAPRPTVENATAAAIVAHLLDTTQQECGPDRVRLEFCTRAEAEYVAGRGVGGCIARVGDIEVTGMVDWRPEHLADARQLAERLAGERVF